MSLPPSQHQLEIQRNHRAWETKPLLRQVYAGLYRRVLNLVEPSVPGRVVELGSGIGNLKTHLPQALGTDLFPNPWLDLVCDAYELPFAAGSVSHLILFDVFHHLEAPRAFLGQARRVLAQGGRVILMEPFISAASLPVYGLFHHEPVAWRQPICLADTATGPRRYYAAQGNATRLFFRRQEAGWTAGWEIFHREAFAGLAYLLSGGFSRPALYPRWALPFLQRMDQYCSRWPRWFGVRCLVGLRAL